ncbi:hypothetical protein D6783_03235, partial [Candidatus Woesearchaeota archaeon]
EVVLLAKELRKEGLPAGVQNFLAYRRGRVPVKPRSMEDFAALLKAWEGELGVRLLVHKEDFGVVDDVALPKPMRKNERVEVVVVSAGRYARECFGVARGRLVKVVGSVPVGKRVRVRITRDKHNIFFGVPD